MREESFLNGKVTEEIKGDSLKFEERNITDDLVNKWSEQRKLWMENFQDYGVSCCIINLLQVKLNDVRILSCSNANIKTLSKCKMKEFSSLQSEKSNFQPLLGKALKRTLDLNGDNSRWGSPSYALFSVKMIYVFLKKGQCFKHRKLFFMSFCSQKDRSQQT